MAGARVRFLLDGAVVEQACTDPTETVLEMLRYRLRRTGTKEGCAEGDCGACTVLVGALEDDSGAVAWRAVNACIAFVPMLDGRALVTVESLAGRGPLNPVQQAMVDCHGSQCGFCTPGFVLSLHGRAMGAEGTGDAPLAEVLAGNLCRCTGYGPILAAGEAVPGGSLPAPDVAAGLRALLREDMLAIEGRDAVSGRPRRWFAPRSLGALDRLCARHPQATIVAGATDVGLWVTKQQRELDTVIWLGEVAELRRIEEDADGLTLGAGTRYTQARGPLARLHPELGALVGRIGGLQVRNSGTIGGNIANGSPIGDMPPALIALGARLILRRGGERRELALEDFFLAYGRQDRAPGEIVESVRIPRPPAGTLVRITKLSKRFASDITAVLGAFALTIAQGRIVSARLAFGGMAGTPRRARAAEAALTGAPWAEATLEAAAAALAQDFAPMSDHRGSAAYRLAVAGNLLRRLWRESAAPGEAVSLADLADG